MMPTSIKKQLSNQHSNLDRFWSQLGLIVGGFGGSRWGQVGTKSLPNRSSNQSTKMITFWIALGGDFAPFWAPTLPPRGGPRNHFSMFLGLLRQSWCQNGPKTSPRPPKSPQGPSKRPPKIDFGTQINGFWTLS